MDHRDDYDFPIMDAGAVRALHARFVASNDNVEPESDEECDGAQLQAVKSKLDADVVPYADFGVFGPRGSRFAKIVKYTAHVWDPTTCTYTPKEFKGPRTLDEWRAHWRVFSFALRCFGAVDRARLQQYANQIERLHSDYANLPGGGWWIIAVADVRMRSEHMEKLRRKAEQTYESNPNSGFDPARPWDWVFALAARDRDFWSAHVKDRAGQYMHHLKSKGDIIGPDAIAAAGEDGDGRTHDKATRTNKPSGSKRRQARAAGRLGGEGESEVARKRGRGFNHGGSWGSGGSGQQPRGPGGCGNNSTILGNYTGHDGFERVQVEPCAFDWTHHVNRIKGEGGGTGTGGTAVLEFPSCGCTIGKGTGGDEGELSTATMVTIGPEAPHRTALYNFEKGNYRRVGKWGNTLVSADHYVESKPPRAATAPNHVSGKPRMHRRNAFTLAKCPAYASRSYRGRSHQADD